MNFIRLEALMAGCPAALIAGLPANFDEALMAGFVHLHQVAILRLGCVHACMYVHVGQRCVASFVSMPVVPLLLGPLGQLSLAPFHATQLGDVHAEFINTAAALDPKKLI